MTKNEIFILWLNDALAMETAASDLLKRYGKDLEKYSDIMEELNKYAQLADQKAARLKYIIEKQNGKISTAKNMLGKLGSLWQSGTSELMHDQVVKNLLATYSGVHLSIASYISLASAAMELGKEEVATFAQECISSGIEFAKWLEVRIPSLTTEFLKQEHSE